jgi:hypothetical protein
MADIEVTHRGLAAALGAARARLHALLSITHEAVIAMRIDKALNTRPIRGVAGGHCGAAISVFRAIYAFPEDLIA